MGAYIEKAPVARITEFRIWILLADVDFTAVLPTNNLVFSLWKRRSDYLKRRLPVLKGM